MDRSMHGSAIQDIVSAFSDSTTVFTLVIVVVLAGVLYKCTSQPQKQNTFPLWATIEVALTSFIVSRDGVSRRIYSSIRRHGGSLFGLTSKHQVLVNLPGVDRLMSQSHHTLNPEPVHYTLFIRVFGAADSAQLKAKFEHTYKDLLKPVEEMFLKDAAAVSAIESGGVPQKASRFVTFSENPERTERWELSAGMRVVRPASPDKLGAVEANLQSLTRDFGACFAIPLLFGHDFLDRYPQLLADFWRFDNDLFPLLMIGIPPCAPLKIVKEGIAARSRLLDEMETLYRRIDQYQRGEPVDFGADMSDISNAALERNKIYGRGNWSIRERGGGELGLL